MNPRFILTVSLLLLLAFGSWYVASSDRSPEVVKTVSDSSFGGYYLRTARILGTDDAGELLYEIEAEYAQQGTSNQIEMQNVRIIYATGANVPWTISADAATIGANEDLLHLYGHVIAVSNEGVAGQVTEIRSPALEIDPINYRAETDSRVQIRIGSRSLTATGMLASLQENKLQLKSNVSGKFVP